MAFLIVVQDLADWPHQIQGVETCTARRYLTEPEWAESRGLQILNLCRSYRYQSMGYYVSLLAEARNHRPMPDLVTIQDLKTASIPRLMADELEREIELRLAPLKSPDFTLSIYFGRNVAARYDRLSQELFRRFRAPFMQAHFQRKGDEWTLQSIQMIAAADIPEEHMDFVLERAREWFSVQRRVNPRKKRHRYDMAILYDPASQPAPSDERAIRHFQKAGDQLGLQTEVLTRDELQPRLAEFDALFIRETTAVHHHTYRLARRAEAQGLVVVDDPTSILKCSNKVFLAELLKRARVATPVTRILHRDSNPDTLGELGLPVILKQPDSSFSQGVVKANTREEAGVLLKGMLAKSDLVIAQGFVPTHFDWRVGILDGQPLFVCKYHMADRHWQIVRREAGPSPRVVYGRTESIPVEQAPVKLIRTALKATGLIGNGLYGVDIKQYGDEFLVIEINDNPNIDAGIEDAILKDELYLRVLGVILRRITERKEGGYTL
jgi:glutathione synthase/RimK-type ligase-like ATP-grasp enzyme